MASHPERSRRYLKFRWLTGRPFFFQEMDGGGIPDARQRNMTLWSCITWYSVSDDSIEAGTKSQTHKRVWQTDRQTDRQCHRDRKWCACDWYDHLWFIPFRLSVRLSVTRVDQSKTVEVRIMQPSPQSSSMTLVSWRLTSPCSSKGKIGSGAPNKRGVWKIRNFQPISRHISEAVQD